MLWKETDALRKEGGKETRKIGTKVKGRWEVILWDWEGGGDVKTVLGEGLGTMGEGQGWIGKRNKHAAQLLRAQQRGKQLPLTPA